MRVFLCAFGHFFLAIPMRSVSSFALHTDGEQANTRNVVVSLPLLLNLPLENIRYDIVLKNPGSECGEDDTAENNIVLLSTAVEREADIPDDTIYPIPKIFNNTRFSALFSGIQCANSPVLLLNTEQLVKYAQKENIV